jgi:hypothetical protein
METEQTRLLQEIHDGVMLARVYLEMHERQLPLIRAKLESLIEWQGENHE